MTTHKERALLMEKAKNLLSQGMSAPEIGKQLYVSAPTIYKWVHEEAKRIKQEYKENIEVPEIKNKKVVFEQAQTPEDILNQGYSVYDYSSDNIGKNGVITEEFGFSRAMLNIPYINFSPPKRIQQTCRSLYEWRTEKGVSVAYRRFTQIEKPDVPLYINEVKYHDCATLNATIGIAVTDEDKHFTSLDACIVSRSFADRFIIKRIHKQTLITKKWDISIGEEVAAGKIYEDMINPLLNKKNEIKLSGKIIKILHVEEVIISGEKVKLNVVLIESKHKLCIGDKLRSLTGLKVVIGDIRKSVSSSITPASDSGSLALNVKGEVECQVPNPSVPKNKVDILINMNQIISKTGKVKGALLKEMVNFNNKVAVGMRSDEILGVDESLYWGSSISITLYPVLKLYDSTLLKRIIQNNFTGDSYIKQLLLSLHLYINSDTGIIKILPENKLDLSDEHYVEAAHYLWHYDNKIKFQQHKEFNQFYREKTGEELKSTTINRFIWDNLYVPDFVLAFYESGGRIRESEYISYIGKSWEERENTPGKGKVPFLVKTKGSSTYKQILKTCLFPKLRKGKYLKAIPQHANKGMVVEIGLGTEFQDKGYITLFREPALDEFSVWSLPVVHNPDLPVYCIRVPPEVMLAMNGDFDGDSICAIPYRSDYFTHKEATLVTPGSADKTDLNKLFKKVPYVSNEEILLEGVKHMIAEKREKKNVEGFGGLRNRIALETEDLNVHKQLLNYAIEIESLMKGERMKPAEQLKETRKKMKALFPEELRYDKSESSYIVLTTKHGKSGVMDTDYLLGFNTRISKFWEDLWL